MDEVDARRRVVLVAGQLIAVWAIGAMGLPIAVGMVFLAGYASGTGALLAAALVMSVVFVALLWLTVRATAAASVLGGTTGRQVLWAVLVFGVGIALWGYWWTLRDEPGLAFSGNGLPFVVVAGVLLRGWRARLATAGILAVVAAAGLVVLVRSGPSEVEERIAHAQVYREELYVVSIPGYRPTDDTFGDELGTRTFLPADPKAIPKPRRITVIAFDRAAASTPGGCGETARDSILATAECTVEPDGWIYRRGDVEHGYQVAAGQHLVVVSGTLSVQQQVLRAAAATVRPLTPAEVNSYGSPGQPLFTVDTAGYSPRANDIPPGVMLESTDPHAAPQSVQIDVFVDWVGNPCLKATCTADGDGLKLRRTDDMHGYVIRRGNTNVYAMGGVGVDRALLRRAALDARPVTDEELLRALPPAPTKGPFDRLRRWLRD